MTQEVIDQEFEDLAAIVADSAARAKPVGAAPRRISASLDDVLRAADRARAAQEASGVVPEPAGSLRAQALQDVFKQLPLEHRKASKEELERRIHPTLLGAAAAWRWSSGCLVLAGWSRTGKSASAVHLVRRLCAEGARHGGEAFELAKSIRWQECRELTATEKEHRRGAGPAPEIVACQHARLLILDDLGATDHKDTIERILNFRIERAWPTITTTGLQAAAIESTFGQGLVYRLLERGSDPGSIVECFEAA